MIIATRNTPTSKEVAHGSFSAREVAAILAAELAARRSVALPRNIGISLSWAPENAAVVVTVTELEE